MRASPEIRRTYNMLRKRYAPKNGVIQAGLLDIVWLERHEAKNAKRRIRRKAEARRALKDGEAE